MALSFLIFFGKKSISCNQVCLIYTKCCFFLFKSVKYRLKFEVKNFDFFFNNSFFFFLDKLAKIDIFGEGGVPLKIRNFQKWPGMIPHRPKTSPNTPRSRFACKTRRYLPKTFKNQVFVTLGLVQQKKNLFFGDLVYKSGVYQFSCSDFSLN